MLRSLYRMYECFAFVQLNTNKKQNHWMQQPHSIVMVFTYVITRVKRKSRAAKIDHESVMLFFVTPMNK